MKFVHVQNELLRDLSIANDISYLNADIQLSNDDVLILPDYLEKSQYKIIQKFLDKNIKFIINNLHEIQEDLELQTFLLDYSSNGIKFVPYTVSQNQIWPADKTFFVPMFYWYYSLFHNLKNNQKKPLHPMQREYTHQFFMPINCEKEFRTRFLELLGPHRLKNSIYSYRKKGICLPNDVTPFNYNFVNIDWYLKTYYSIVVETTVFGTTRYDGKFITEKTFKPIQFGHPFMILAENKVLQVLQENEFKTFPYLFNENYDKFEFVDHRMEAIIKNVDTFDKSILDYAFSDIEHNYNRFYNVQLVTERIQNEIIDPILKFTELTSIR
jgi:hypothetical protein